MSENDIFEIENSIKYHIHIISMLFGDVHLTWSNVYGRPPPAAGYGPASTTEMRLTAVEQELAAVKRLLISLLLNEDPRI